MRKPDIVVRARRSRRLSHTCIIGVINKTCTSFSDARELSTDLSHTCHQINHTSSCCFTSPRPPSGLSRISRRPHRPLIMILNHLFQLLMSPNSRHSLPFTTLSLALLSCLPTTTALEQYEKTAADYYVRSLPGAPDGPLLKMHAGYVELGDMLRQSLIRDCQAHRSQPRDPR